MSAHFVVEPMRGRNRRGGFTLIEVLISLIIIGIVVATVAPAVGRSMAQTRVQNAASVIASDINRAFSMAAQRRTPIRIVIDTAGKHFRITNRVQDTVYMVHTFNSSSDIGLSRMQASATTMVIFPNGLASDTLAITVHAPGDIRRRIRATRAGQVRIITP
jgi:prepilin-type N-terminal cleavage/methylation domain-containing protein